MVAGAGKAAGTSLSGSADAHAAPGTRLLTTESDEKAAGAPLPPPKGAAVAGASIWLVTPEDAGTAAGIPLPTPAGAGTAAGKPPSTTSRAALAAGTTPPMRAGTAATVALPNAIDAGIAVGAFIATGAGIGRAAVSPILTLASVAPVADESSPATDTAVDFTLRTTGASTALGKSILATGTGNAIGTPLSTIVGPGAPVSSDVGAIPAAAPIRRTATAGTTDVGTAVARPIDVGPTIAGDLNEGETELSDPPRMEAAPRAAAKVGVGATAAGGIGLCATGVEAGGMRTVDIGAVDDDEADLSETGVPTSGDDCVLRGSAASTFNVDTAGLDAATADTVSAALRVRASSAVGADTARGNGVEPPAAVADAMDVGQRGRGRLISGGEGVAASLPGAAPKDATEPPAADTPAASAGEASADAPVSVAPDMATAWGRTTGIAGKASGPGATGAAGTAPAAVAASPNTGAVAVAGPTMPSASAELTAI